MDFTILQVNWEYFLIEKFKKIQIAKERHNTSSDSCSSNSSDSAVQSSLQSSSDLSDQEADSITSSQTIEKESSGVFDLDEEVEEEEEDGGKDEEDIVLIHEKCPYLNRPWTEIKKTIVGFQDNGLRISEIEDYVIPLVRLSQFS